MTKNILKIIGIPDDNKSAVVHNDGLFRQFALFFDGNSSFLENVNFSNMHISTLHLGGAEQLQNIRLPFKPNIIVNSICDPEIQNRSLALLDDMKLADHIPMLNTTEGIRKTKRDVLSQSLPLDDKFIIPKTVRIAPKSPEEIFSSARENFGDKPFLFRPVSSHGGDSLIRVSPDEPYYFYEYALDEREYFITEFIDFSSSDGLYRKARFFVIDGKVYPRHLVISDSWKIHASSKTNIISKSKMIEEEVAFSKKIPSSFEEFGKLLYTHLKLDFFGVDCSILPDGKIVLFEANVCMRPFSINPSQHLHEAREEINNAFFQMLAQRASK